MSHEKGIEAKEGAVPFVLNHCPAIPLFFNFENSVIEKISDKISRQYVIGAQTMLVKWVYKKGAVIPLHFHPHEQITWITEGVAEVKSQGKTFTVKAGEVIIFPAFVPHEFFIPEDTVNIDIFTPVREDWFARSEYYLKAGHK